MKYITIFNLQLYLKTCTFILIWIINAYFKVLLTKSENKRTPKYRLVKHTNFCSKSCHFSLFISELVSVVFLQLHATAVILALSKHLCCHSLLHTSKNANIHSFCDNLSYISTKHIWDTPSTFDLDVLQWERQTVPRSLSYKCI